MSCEQKSGVFLKERCKRTVTNTCANCEKKICHVHFHHYEAADLCEDCYWEKYLYAEEKKQQTDTTYDDSDDTIITSTPYSTTNTDDAGFDGGFGGGGFGGGGFGGGGASGEWNESEAQSFNETDNGGGLLDNDDTFYYS